MRNFNAPSPSKVLVEVELFLELQRLVARISLPGALARARAARIRLLHPWIDLVAGRSVDVLRADGVVVAVDVAVCAIVLFVDSCGRVAVAVAVGVVALGRPISAQVRLIHYYAAALFFQVRSCARLLLSLLLYLSIPLPLSLSRSLALARADRSSTVRSQVRAPLSLFARRPTPIALTC